MCCFSRNVSFVKNTRIFARPLGGGVQAVAYQMSLGAPEDLAMILPLPVERKAAKKPLEFVNLEKYDKFFDDLAKDFARVDERFRLPDGIWEKLGDYADASFAVFKLREGEKKIHPMAFRFHVRDPSKLFFPTVHVHDGKVHETENFDHTLYCQVPARGLRSLLEWQESPRTALHFTKAGLSRGLIDPRLHVHRRLIKDRHKNEDIYLPIA